jgi:hypothetical protein
MQVVFNHNPVIGKRVVQQNCMVERVTWPLTDQYTHRHRFETQQHASRVIGD